MKRPLNFISKMYLKTLSWSVLVLAICSGIGLILMMLTTCADVLFRAFGHPITGSYDIVRILGVLTIAFALPYTTAVKGHIAVEYFFHKFHWVVRIILDSIIRFIVIALFIVLAVQNVKYGLRLAASGTVTATLQLPVFWVPYVIAFTCGIVVLVVLHNLLHPGKAMIRP